MALLAYHHTLYNDTTTMMTANIIPTTAPYQNPLLLLVDAAEAMKKDPQSIRSSTSSSLATTMATASSSQQQQQQQEKKPINYGGSSKRRKRGIKRSFADTLMELLLDERYADTVKFLPDGQSWGIADARKFASEVMPRVFGIRTFSSFVRKLHRWGFERVMEKKTHGVDIFRHAQFRKGDWQACHKLKCSYSVTAAKNKKQSNNSGNNKIIEDSSGIKTTQQRVVCQNS